MALGNRQLGNSTLMVSPFALGGMTFGNKTWGCGHDETEKIIHCYLDYGLNFIDTADSYGDGLSESFIGQSIKGRRDKVILATKVGSLTSSNPKDKGLSRQHIMKALNDSLQRLGTDYIDLYQAHAFDPVTPIEESLDALNECVKSGKVRHIGCCNFSAWQTLKCNYLSRQHNASSYISLQMQYSLLCRTIEYEHVPFAIDQNIGILAWSPLSGGILARNIEDSNRLGGRHRVGTDAFSKEKLNKPKNKEIISTLCTLAHRANLPPSALALSWNINRPGITACVLGATSIDQLESNLKAIDYSIPKDVMNSLNQLSEPPRIYPYNFQKKVNRLFSIEPL